MKKNYTGSQNDINSQNQNQNQYYGQGQYQNQYDQNQYTEQYNQSQYDQSQYTDQYNQINDQTTDQTSNQYTDVEQFGYKIDRGGLYPVEGTEYYEGRERLEGFLSQSDIYNDYLEEERYKNNLLIKGILAVLLILALALPMRGVFRYSSIYLNTFSHGAMKGIVPAFEYHGSFRDRAKVVYNGKERTIYLGNGIWSKGRLMETPENAKIVEKRQGDPFVIGFVRDAKEIKDEDGNDFYAVRLETEYGDCYVYGDIIAIQDIYPDKIPQDLQNKYKKFILLRLGISILISAALVLIILVPIKRIIVRTLKID